MQVTHLGHACLLVQAGDARVLIDPGNLTAGLRAVGGVDAVVITHQHRDHCDPELLTLVLRNNPSATVFAEPQAGETLTEVVGPPAAVELLHAGQEVAVGSVSLLPVGDLHAPNHPGVPRVGNLGVVVRADDEPSLFHPGDAYDADPGPVDVLALPLNAPWTGVADTLAFLRRIGPRLTVPIHDALLSSAGRALYLQHIAGFGPQGGKIRDLSDGVATQLT